VATFVGKMGMASSDIVAWAGDETSGDIFAKENHHSQTFFCE